MVLPALDTSTPMERKWLDFLFFFGDTSAYTGGLSSQSLDLSFNLRSFACFKHVLKAGHQFTLSLFSLIYI